MADDELVHVERLVWEEEEDGSGQAVRKRVMGVGNGELVPKAEAVAGIKAGNCRAAGHPVGKVPEEWEPAKAFRRKDLAAEAAEENGRDRNSAG